LLKLVAPFKGWVALSVLLGFATILSGIGLMATSAYLISSAALHPSIASLQVAIVGVRFFGLSRGVFRYLERLVSHDVTFRLLGQLRLNFYQALHPLAPARLMGARSGDLLARIVGDIESLENFYVRAVAPPLVAALVALAMGFFFARFSLALCLVVLVFMLLAGVGVPALIRRLSREPGLRLVEGRAAMSAALVDGIQGMPDLLAFNQEARQSELIQKLSAGLARAQKRMAHLAGFQAGSELFLAQLCLWSVLLIAIPLVATGQVQGVYLAVLALAALTSFEAVAPLPQAAQYLESNLQSARRLFAVVDTKPEVRDPEQPLPLPQAFTLKAENLRFHYPSPLSLASSAHYALDGITFNLPPGKRLAIVGLSGAGKSTLAYLLLRFWDFTEGQISLSGGDLRRYAQDAVRGRIAYVAQETYLFNASLRDNLLLARPQASQAELERAAQQARIHEFILRLPEGYDTWIGEQGLQLSAGERQRLAIARALLRDSPLLILDEPTANLDAITERQVLDTMLEASQDRATLLITHRLAGMEAMDEILVLDGGRVVERGRHGELLARYGLYRSMWELQNQLLPEDIA